jgi:hypothetical protein
MRLFSELTFQVAIRIVDRAYARMMEALLWSDYL